MIPSKDLRIGNLVIWGPYVEVVAKIESDRINIDITRGDNKSGIPITSLKPIILNESLIKSLSNNFIFEQGSYVYKGDYYMRIMFKHSDRIDIIIDSKASTVKIKRAKVASLHALQNLYYEITGGAELCISNERNIRINE